MVVDRDRGSAEADPARSVADLFHAHVPTGNSVLNMILCGAMQMHWDSNGAVVERAAAFTQAMVRPR
jgi:hypothetical protein